MGGCFSPKQSSVTKSKLLPCLPELGYRDPHLAIDIYVKVNRCSSSLVCHLPAVTLISRNAPWPKCWPLQKAPSEIKALLPGFHIQGSGWCPREYMVYLTSTMVTVLPAPYTLKNCIILHVGVRKDLNGRGLSPSHGGTRVNSFSSFPSCCYSSSIVNAQGLKKTLFPCPPPLFSPS